MKHVFVSGKDLIKMGFPEGKVIGLVINTVNKHFRRIDAEEVQSILVKLISNPRDFEKDERWSGVVSQLLHAKAPTKEVALLPKRIDYRIFGAAFIEEGARHQMEVAMKLPVTLAGALMADAHQGYGLPIGGVLATKNAVIPYGVGVDIGCRMCLTAYPLGEVFLNRNRDKLTRMLLDHTRFGFDCFERPKDHEVLDRTTFDEIKLLRGLKDKAARQIGSSGTGNHFVEFGLLKLQEPNEWELLPGVYLAVLSHSGSRGLGAEVARHYTKVAKASCRLPGEASNLAWLDLSSEAGQEYWMAMNLAGDYSAANHDQIHQRLAKALGEQPLFKVENHHNFAWRETLEDGTAAIVHRKGATPAGEGILGIIPGSMTAPGFLVKGKGASESLNSASHGAGRVLSRSAAKNSITGRMVKLELKKHDVELIGGGVDEAPMAYKDIHAVMESQTELVDILGEFQPKIVRMCGDDSPAED